MKSGKPPSAAARTLPLYDVTQFLPQSNLNEPATPSDVKLVIRIGSVTAGVGFDGKVLSDHYAFYDDVAAKLGETLCKIAFNDPQRGGNTKNVCQECRIQASKLRANITNRWPSG